MATRHTGIDLLKIIALTTMVIDHLKYISPKYEIYLTTIGRFAFIMFACSIAHNAHQIFQKKLNSSTHAYLKNLIVFSILSEIPFQLANYTPNQYTLNIMPTLLIGFLLIGLANSSYKTTKKILMISVIAASSVAIHQFIQYGVVGILLIVSFYCFFRSNTSITKICSISFIIFSAVFPNIQILLGFNLLNPTILFWLTMTICSCLSAVALCLYLTHPKQSKIKARVPKVGKWAWWFYPAHLLIIGILAKII